MRTPEQIACGRHGHRFTGTVYTIYEPDRPTRNLVSVCCYCGIKGWHHDPLLVRLADKLVKWWRKRK